MVEEKGTISIHSENIFPIIKKFLYSDTEIFLRELVSNAVDATQKLKHLASIGEADVELGELKVKVALDEEAKTITISDSGVGMTADEIKKYINQIAFSGATEFVEKYKDGESDPSQIIGHFGLGFYSAYMVADLVEIQTLSHQKDAEPAHWTCDGSTEFEIKTGTKTERGTDIILHVGEDGVDYLKKEKIAEILNKYGKFLPIEIEWEGEVINNPSPIWTKNPTELKDEDYLAFYKELYPFSEDPLFWIHLNVDYPFNLTGVLYFPKVKNDMELQRNKIHLYSRQVFITDEVKDVVPEFLTLLHGVIDSPDIPLNVSRSFLQADSNVKKINSHITKKVADKLKEISFDDRAGFEEKWEDVSVFVRYGMLSEEKFHDKAQSFALFKTTSGDFRTFDEYKEKNSALQTDKDNKLVIPYTTNVDTQDAFIQPAVAKGYEVVLFDGPIDAHFIGHVEQKWEGVQLKRVDSEAVDKLIDKGENLEMVLSDSEKEKVKEIFEQNIDITNKTVVVEPLSSDELPVTISMPEFMRRMKDMGNMGGMAMMGNFPDQFTLTINGNHPMIQKILKAKAKQPELVQQAYDIALLSQGMLKGGELTTFLKRSVELVS